MSKQYYVEVVLLVFLIGFIMKTFGVDIRDWQYWVLYTAGAFAIFFICDKIFRD